MPVTGETDNIRSKYLKLQAKRLKRLIQQPDRRKAAVYVVGKAGSGKSALFRYFWEMYRENRALFPILVPFPYYGGLAAFYNRALRRIPWRDMPRSSQQLESVGSSWSWYYRLQIGGMTNAPSVLERLSATPQNAFHMFSGLVKWVTEGLGREKIIFLLDDFEWAYDRFVGWQKYHWEYTMATLCQRYGPKIVWVLPVNPRLSGEVREGSMPYFQPNKWKIGGDVVDLPYRFQMGDNNMLQLEGELELLSSDLKRLVRRVSTRNPPSEYAKSLMNELLNTDKSVGELLAILYVKVQTDAFSPEPR